MQFNKLVYYVLNEGNDDGKEIPPEEKPEDAYADEINKKIVELGDIAVDKFDKLLDTKIDVIINKIQKTSIDEVLEEFVAQKFVPSLDNPDDKLFVTVNIDDFLLYLSQKFSERLINGSTKKDDKKSDEKTDEKDDKKSDGDEK